MMSPSRIKVLRMAQWLVALPFVALLTGLVVYLAVTVRPPSTHPQPPSWRVTGILQESGGLAATPTGIPGTVTLTSNFGRKYIVGVRGDGTFSAGVLDGTYTVVGHSPLFQDDQLPCFGSTSFVVNGGATTPITVTCQLR